MLRSPNQQITGLAHWAKRHRKRILIATKLLVTVVALFALFSIVDRGMLVSRLHAMDGRIALVVVAAAVAQILLISIRWQLIIRHLRATPPPFRDTLTISYAGQFFGQVLPFVAGDGLRAWLLNVKGFELRLAAESVMIDRAVGLFVLVLIALPPIWIAPILHDHPDIARPIAWLVSTLVASAVLVLALAGPLHRFLGRWPVLNIVAEVDIRARDLFLSFLGIPVVLISLAVHGLSIFSVFVLAHAIGMPLSLVDCFALVPIMLLSAMLPIAVGGWGVREGVAMAILPAAGYSSDAALLLSLLFGATLAIAALPGIAAWFYLARTDNRKAEPA
ncbi:MAG: lysylphosphatidylglycerol synthase transmembrane domain-containing protein [Pseudorhodoplanes sp.]